MASSSGLAWVSAATEAELTELQVGDLMSHNDNCLASLDPTIGVIMGAHIGLYYPFIHFRDESWLKLTSLYWDRMGRIVPEGYGLRATIRSVNSRMVATSATSTQKERKPDPDLPSENYSPLTATSFANAMACTFPLTGPMTRLRSRHGPLSSAIRSLPTFSARRSLLNSSRT
jgi:hypothetical protein